MGENNNLLTFYWQEATSSDFEGKFSLILYTKTCSLACYGCHNRRMLNWWDYKDNIYRRNQKVSVDNCMIEPISWENIELELTSGFYEAVILCGWEVTIHPLEKIINTIQKIKEINPNLLIRVDTSSIFPEKMEELKKYVDWFACDIKFPYWNFWNTWYDEVAEEIIWLPKNVLEKIFPKMVKWLEIAKWLPYTIYRSVKYPIQEIISNLEIESEKKDTLLNNSINYFKEIENYAKEKLESNNYYTNNFVYV